MMTISSAAFAQLPNPCYGFNLGNSLEATWGISVPSQAVFTTAANSGFNAVRVPCAWDYNSDPNTHQINAAYMAQVKQVVDWAIGAGMYVVINDHWDDGWLENHIGTTVDPTINAKMNSYWTQIATTFAGYDNHLLFAAANEPNVGSPAAMNTLMAYYQTFVNAVRGVGGSNTNRWLVLQGGGDTAWLNTMPTDPTPGRLMVEYHNYTPFQFTQLGGDASWGNMQYFWGPAYHYAGDPTRNAVSPEEGYIDLGFQDLTDRYVRKGIPVMVGEFQAAGKSGLTGTEASYNRTSCIYWNKYLVDAAQSHGLSPFYWSTPSSPFDYSTGNDNSPDVVAVLTGGVAPAPLTDAPFAASHLTATAVGAGQINLSWTAGSGATSYTLYRAAESGYESPIAPVVTGITGTSYSDSGLNDGTTYYYQVVAVNGSGPSGFSAEAHASTSGVNPDPAQFNFETDTQFWAPSGSQISGVATSTAQHFAGRQSLAVNFNGAAAGTSTVSLGSMGSSLAIPAGSAVTVHVWIPSGSNITSIEPYLQDHNWAWTSNWVGSLTSGAWNTVTLTMPSSDVTPLQQFGIRFTTSAAWTGTCYVDSISWPTVPAAPTSLTATAGNGQVSLSWSASSNATSYVVYRATTAGGEGAAPIATGITSTTYTNSGLTNGTTYYYKVAAVNSIGTSGQSNEASAKPGAAPSAPTGLTATAGTAQVALAWSATSGASSYNAYRSTTVGGEGSTAIATGITSTTYTNTGLTNGTTYFYKVAAVNSFGTSGQSNEASATPTAGANLVGDGTYTVVGVQSGRALDDPGWSTASGTQMDIWTVNNGNNQKWILSNLGNNTVKLINVFSGLSLEVKQSLKTNGAVVDQAAYTGAPNQQWNVVQVSSGIYNLKNVNSGEVLDVAGKKTADGTLVDQWPSNNGMNQQWKFQ